MTSSQPEPLDAQPKQLGDTALSQEPANFFVVTLVAERDQLPQWLAVAFGGGALLYFSLHVEPPWWLTCANIAVATLLAWGMRRWVAWSFVAYVLLSVALGVGMAQWRVNRVAAPVLSSEIDFTNITGRVVTFEPQQSGYRLVLDNVTIDDVSGDQVPLRVRVTARGAQENWIDIRPGDWISGRAGLSPPSGPAYPGGFDFQRNAWFQRLGAVGFTFGQPEIIPPPPGPGTGGAERFQPFRIFSTGVEGLRQKIFLRISQALPGQTGAVAAALMVGKRGAIPEEVQVAMRQAGLAHLLAISGLHLGLLAGLIFFIVRGGLALFPRLALRYPIKKWAAFIALGASLFYLFIAGATVPTQRSFAMLALVLGAVMIDRSAISMRLVGWAAVVILAFRPESLVGASFQLSFSAVIALVAAYEAMGDRWRFSYGRGRFLRRALIYLAGVSMTTVIAGTATAPFALQIFHQVAVYGVAGNIVAVPIVALWVMPLALLAFVLMPFGLDFIALIPMGWGIDLVISVATHVAAWPGSTFHAPSLPGWGFGLVVSGGLWLALWRRPWRLWGVGAIAIGLWSASFINPPDILVAGDASLVGIRVTPPQGTEKLLVSQSRRNRFTRGVWLEALGLDEWEKFPDSEPSQSAELMCDRLGCIYRKSGTLIAVPTDIRALNEDCGSADIIISTVPVPRTCTGPRLVIDFFDLRYRGAHSIWLGTDDAGRSQSANERRGRRPWVR